MTYPYAESVGQALAQSGASGEPVVWDRMTWPALKKLREQGMDTVILPTGAIEQHGPHLPLNTDVAIASGISLYASALTGVPVLPCIPYTNSLGHTDHWPGTISSTPETLITMVREIADWVARAGFSRLLMINSHYGNDAPLRCAIDHIRSTMRGRLTIGLRNTWALSEEARSFYLMDGEDIHANRAETSLMLALDPDAVARHDQVDDPDRTAGCVFTWTVMDTSRNGVTGRPSEASREEGIAMLAKLGADLAGILQRARDERAPLQSPSS